MPVYLSELQRSSVATGLHGLHEYTELKAVIFSGWPSSDVIPPTPQTATRVANGGAAEMIAPALTPAPKHTGEPAATHPRLNVHSEA
jgi:hypothetical protein